MMTFQEIVREIPKLSFEERKALVTLLVETFTAPDGDNVRSILELEGLGAEIWDGIDAQEYVDQLRSEWDHRP
jgi:hypothetical protein